MSDEPIKVRAYGVFDGVETPETVRFSTVVRALRRQGNEAIAQKLEAEQKAVGSRCDTHGELADPVIGLLGDRVAFGCPWCSGSAVLAAWEREGMAS